jgi:hypothetical protein
VIFPVRRAAAEIVRELINQNQRAANVALGFALTAKHHLNNDLSNVSGLADFVVL